MSCAEWVSQLQSAKGIQGKETWGKEVFLEEVTLDPNLER